MALDTRQIEVVRDGVKQNVKFRILSSGNDPRDKKSDTAIQLRGVDVELSEVSIV